MARFGGPKWIPRGGIPIRRRRRRGAWVVNGLTYRSQFPTTVNYWSSLFADRDADPATLNWNSHVQQFRGGGTDLQGYLLTTFDDKTIEDADFTSINQADSLSTSISVKKIQGFINLRNVRYSAGADFALPNKLSVFITKQQSTTQDNIDQVAAVDPTLWRGSELVWHKFVYLAGPFDQPHGGSWEASQKTLEVNLRTRMRLKKNECLALWVTADPPADETSFSYEILWALRTYCVRAGS